MLTKGRTWFWLVSVGTDLASSDLSHGCPVV